MSAFRFVDLLLFGQNHWTLKRIQKALLKKSIRKISSFLLEARDCKQNQAIKKEENYEKIT